MARIVRHFLLLFPQFSLHMPLCQPYSASPLRIRTLQTIFNCYHISKDDCDKALKAACG